MASRDDRDIRDYNAEAYKLFELLNLSPTGAASDASAKLHRYHDLDAIWQHPTSGGRVFIGNLNAAGKREIMQQNGVTHVVNCTSDMENKFEGTDIIYYRFDIYKHIMALEDIHHHKGVLEAFMPVFEWIDAAAAAGHGVLIHCLAGAHRAGTTGCAYAMHASNLDHQTAIAACKACRPIVDPIGDLTGLLHQLEIARKLNQGKTVSEYPL